MLSEAAAAETGLPAPEPLPLSASACLSRPRGFRLLGLRVPGRHLGVPGKKKHGSLPGTMHARTSTPPPAGAGSRAVPPQAFPADTSVPKSGAVLCWVRVHLPFSPLYMYFCLGTLTHFIWFLFFLTFEYWQLKRLFRIAGSWNRVNTARARVQLTDNPTDLERENGLNPRLLRG